MPVLSLLFCWEHRWALYIFSVLYSNHSINQEKEKDARKEAEDKKDLKWKRTVKYQAKDNYFHHGWLEGNETSSDFFKSFYERVSTPSWSIFQLVQTFDEGKAWMLRMTSKGYEAVFMIVVEYRNTLWTVMYSTANGHKGGHSAIAAVTVSNFKALSLESINRLIAYQLSIMFWSTFDFSVHVCSLFDIINSSGLKYDHLGTAHYQTNQQKEKKKTTK